MFLFLFSLEWGREFSSVMLCSSGFNLPLFRLYLSVFFTNKYDFSDAQANAVDG